MKRILFVLLAVLVLGIMGLGCDDTKEVVIGEGNIVSFKVQNMSSSENYAVCDIVIETVDNVTLSFLSLQMVYSTIPQPIDSQKIYKVIKYDRSLGIIWYAIKGE